MTIESRRLSFTVCGLAICLMLSGVLSGCVAEARVVGVDFDGNYWEADPLTGLGTILGHTGLTGLNSMAADAAATLYTADSSALYTLDFDNGQSTLVTPIALGTDLVAIQAMAFAPNGTLYVANDADATGGNASDLWTIDISSGVGTLIGSVGQVITAMDFREDTMYAYAQGLSSPVGPGLGTIDMTTAAFTDLDPNESSIDIQSITFKAPLSPAAAPRCCELFAAAEFLYGMDPVNGEAIPIGLIDPTNHSVLTGIEGFFLVPEPATSLWLIWAAVVGILVHHRGQR